MSTTSGTRNSVTCSIVSRTTLGHPLALGQRHLQDELVVHGEHHAAREASGRERAVEIDHRQLEDVGRTPLHRRVLRHALAHLPDPEVVRGELGELAAPPEQRRRETRGFCLPDRLGHVGGDVRERGEVRVEDLAGLIGGDVEPRAEPVRLHAVGEPVVDDFGEAPLELVDLLLVDMEDRRGRRGVHVGTALEGLDESRVLARGAPAPATRSVSSRR